MNSNKLKRNNGITLIALVITIIVMLILVAVTISMAVNGGLFEYAGKATGETNNAIREEQQLASGKITVDNQVYNSIDEYLKAQKGGAGNGGNNAGGDIQGIDGEVYTALYTETKSYTDKNGKTAMIPKGFSVGKSDGINTIDEGLVIQDAKGNQFVWIPVEYIATGTLDANGLDSEFLNVFKRSTTLTSCKEPYTNGYEGEDTEYYEMMLSVQENKGFYIGRFEAGTEEPRYKGVANGTDELVVKRDVYPYNFVAWGKAMDDYESIIKWDFDNWQVNDETGLDQGHGAVYLSKHLLDGQTTDAVSTLCYGVQWDAMLKFIGKDEETDSTEWGNYYNNAVIIDRPTAKYAAFIYNEKTFLYEFEEWTEIPEGGKNKSNSESILLTTGASDEFELKNIYDVAGNKYEWTMEAKSSGVRVSRGGDYNNYGDNIPAVIRESNESFNCCDSDSFRSALYITNE